MKIGAIGDDFTGSSDIANTLAKAGARTLQYVGIPATAVGPEVDAVIISLKTRSARPGEAVSQSLAACRWLVANGAGQIVQKYCSTFDSTPHGNIGPVAEALLKELDAPLALVCPAFPANGRTLYQGHLFVHDRLLNESGMQHHPLTPMTDPDIRRWLALQTSLRVGHIALADVRSRIEEALARQTDLGARLIVADAITDDDLLALGQAAKDHRLVTGGSGIAMGLPANFGISPDAATQTRFAGAAGPALVLSGSCSNATRGQVARFRDAGHPALKIAAADVLDRAVGFDKAIDFILDRKSEAPMVYSSDSPDAVAADQARFGRDKLAEAYDGFFADLTRTAVDRGFRRIVSAGGETSGAVASSLGGSAFRIGPEIASGVPALETLGEPRVAAALKSGNFGDADFFARAVRILGETA